MQVCVDVYTCVWRERERERVRGNGSADEDEGGAEWNSWWSETARKRRKNECCERRMVAWKTDMSCCSCRGGSCSEWREQYGE